MKRIVFCLAAVAALSACETSKPKAHASVGANGASGSVGTSAGPVNVGVNADGNVHANANVVNSEHVNVSVGKGGVSPTVKAGPVRVGKNGVRLKM